MIHIFQKMKKVFVERYMARFHPTLFVKNIGVKVGKQCRFLTVSRSTFGSEPYLIEIGDHVTITGGVKFVTHDGGVWIFRMTDPEIDVFAPIKIGNNVFIGLNTIIMPGTIVGDNVVIGAGAVVTGILEPDSIYAGVPARKIMSMEEYKIKVMTKAEFIRSKAPSWKREYLIGKYFND